MKVQTQQMCLLSLAMGIVLGSSIHAYFNPPSRSAEVSQAEAQAADPSKELPDRVKTLTPIKKTRSAVIIMVLQEQRIQALARGLPPWVKQQFVTFERAKKKGLAFERSVAWGVGWYNGGKFHWFAYSSPDGWLQMNLSASLNKRDVGEIAANRRLEARATERADMPGTATHLALSEGGVDWVAEFCYEGDYVCNTAGALEKHLLSTANSVMPAKLAFFINGRFPY